MGPAVKFTYFDLLGKGELIRLLLTKGGVDFEDNRISFAEWGNMKPTTTFGQLPMMTWDGLEMAQSHAIVRYVAKKVGLAGKTDEDFFQADMILEHTNDIWKDMPGLRFAAPDVKQAKAEEFLKTTFPKFLDGAEKMLKMRGGEWYAGNQLTFADFAMYMVLFFISWPEEKGFQDVTGCDGRFKLLDNYPLAKANFIKIQNIPEIKKYLDTRKPGNPPGL
ncbi:glutathione S-transferase isoform X2 [Eurytemora carolleeae]|uniref:glutathione S-transferase isoform X2 n=1 Tax=Eurytemora carolleeae TaxID=1294199 RepID=UPI000C78AC77|nr:glutathione S-transferase isoform X2 [Eurytemora carolleeae]|eukprot:XP_023345226.1 glutathione S-transferase-like isoform X2 [Eurytemora affinis]